MKKIRLPLFIFLGIWLVYGIRYCWVSFPIISGYGAKVLCSAVFVSGRAPELVKKEELAAFPLSLGHFTVDLTDSSVTGTVLGMARKKAIFRKGLGATLVSEMNEGELRSERMSLAAAPPVKADTVAWPMGDKLTDTVPNGVDTSVLQRAMDSAFIEKDPEHPMRTRAMVIVYKGQLVAERYGNGFSRTTPLLGWSMTKSVTSALVGILVKEGRLTPDAPAPVAEWSGGSNPNHVITLKNLLQQTSGLDFVEDYSKYSDATRMLFGRANMGGYTAEHPLKDTPGTKWYYSSGNSNIISRIVRMRVGDAGYYKFPYERLFYPLGMYSAVLEPDPSGTFVGSSYMYATARDWARFGLLYLGDGIYNGQRILPEGWVTQTATPAAAAPKGQYGYQWWLNAGTKGDPGDRTFVHAPADLMYCDGYEGQYVFVIPSRKLVIVRLGLSHGKSFDADRVLELLLKAFN